MLSFLQYLTEYKYRTPLNKQDRKERTKTSQDNQIKKSNQDTKQKDEQQPKNKNLIKLMQGALNIVTDPDSGKKGVRIKRLGKFYSPINLLCPELISGSPVSISNVITNITSKKSNFNLLIRRMLNKDDVEIKISEDSEGSGDDIDSEQEIDSKENNQDVIIDLKKQLISIKNAFVSSQCWSRDKYTYKVSGNHLKSSKNIKEAFNTFKLKSLEPDGRIIVKDFFEPFIRSGVTPDELEKIYPDLMEIIQPIILYKYFNVDFDIIINSNGNDKLFDYTIIDDGIKYPISAKAGRGATASGSGFFYPPKEDGGSQKVLPIKEFEDKIIKLFEKNNKDAIKPDIQRGYAKLSDNVKLDKNSLIKYLTSINISEDGVKKTKLNINLLNDFFEKFSSLYSNNVKTMFSQLILSADDNVHLKNHDYSITKEYKDLITDDNILSMRYIRLHGDKILNFLNENKLNGKPKQYIKEIRTDYTNLVNFIYTNYKNKSHFPKVSKILKEFILKYPDTINIPNENEIIEYKKHTDKVLGFFYVPMIRRVVYQLNMKYCGKINYLNAVIVMMTDFKQIYGNGFSINNYKNSFDEYVKKLNELKTKLKNDIIDINGHFSKKPYERRLNRLEKRIKIETNGLDLILDIKSAVKFPWKFDVGNLWSGNPFRPLGVRLTNK